MKKFLVLILFTIAFYSNLLGQKRWAIGVSGSADKLTYALNGIKAAQYTLNYGSSLNLNVQYEFNKHWFIRTGVSYFFYSYQYYASTSVYYVNSSIVYSNNSYYTEGLMEVPVSIGYQVPLHNSSFRFYATLGAAFGDYIYEKHLSVFQQNPGNTQTTFSNDGFDFSHGTFGLNLLGTLGLSYSINTNLLAFGGINYRNEISRSEFGSFGLQLGVMYYLGKSHEGKMSKSKK